MRNLHRSIVIASLCAACTIEGTEGVQREPFSPSSPAAPYMPPPPVAQTRRIVILHTNDEHSHLIGFRPSGAFPFLPEANGTVTAATVGTIATKILTGADQQTVGGLVRRQFLINQIRAQSVDPVLLLSGGDVMMGTVFHLATQSAAPDYLAMAALGYDFATIGNHEFDWGPDVLAASIEVANNTTFGGAVPLVASNIHFEDVQAGGTASALKAMYGDGEMGALISPYRVKVLANGLKVGFIGLLGYDAALVAPAKSPISFSTPDGGAACTTTCASSLDACIRGRCVNPLDANGHVAAMAAEAQTWVDYLRNDEGVDVVISINHVGEEFRGNTLVGEDVALAQLTHGIDVIIGGHSHREIPPTVINSLVGSGGTIIVQAGSYGTKLGKLNLTVAPDGTVDYEASELITVDHTVDAQIIAGSNLGTGVLSPAFETALTMTGGVLGPVIGGLNQQFAQAVLGPGATLFTPVAASTYDITGEVAGQDHNLLHLVTDAERGVLMGGACLVHDPANRQIVVDVQGNGVIRESLHHQLGSNAISFADVFQVLSLGASPLDGGSAPGYPIVLFRMLGVYLYAGADVGVSQGLVADSFFLSYAGMRVSYNTNNLPFGDSRRPVLFDPASTDPQGRVTKIEVDNGAGGWQTLYEYQTGVPWVAQWTNFNPLSDTVVVVTNMYLAGFVEKLLGGLSAFFGPPLRQPENGATFTPIPQLGALSVLGQTITCQVAAVPNCGGGQPSIRRCIVASGGQVPWPAGFREVKEWGALLSYLTSPAALNGQVPPGLYDSPVVSRVIDVTP